MTQRPTARRSRGNLVMMLTETLRDEIRRGHLKPGDKLPTELAQSERFNVSRNVVREAVAGLRADGLVEPRQGAGVFVLKAPGSHYGLAGVASGPLRLSTAIEILELRAAVEIEATGLAAVRRSPAQLARILECFEAISAAVADGQDGAEDDFRFHIAVAEATNNPRFGAFLAYLGKQAIPRAQVTGQHPVDRKYLEQIQKEHETILDTIAAGIQSDARDAMRLHLKGSQDRYSRLRQQA